MDEKARGAAGQSYGERGNQDLAIRRRECEQS